MAQVIKIKNMSPNATKMSEIAVPEYFAWIQPDSSYLLCQRISDSEVNNAVNEMTREIVSVPNLSDVLKISEVTISVRL